MNKFNVILYADFETLDACGPAEVIGYLQDLYALGYYSANGGVVESRHGLKTHTLPFSEIDSTGVLLIPGGIGARSLVGDQEYLRQIKSIAEKAPYVLTVCTGSALLAKTGLLNGRKATSNKKSFTWASSNSAEVEWVKKARWVVDGKYYTSSGVSAGIDMTLGFVSDLHGIAIAREIAEYIEYIWHTDKNNDPFAVD